MLRLPDPPLADDRVLLREWGMRDLGAVVAACRDPLVQRYTRVPDDYGEDDGRAFIVGAARQRLLGEGLDLAVADRRDDRVLGAIGLVMDRHDERRAEIGYWVAPAERGAGVAGRALALLARWAVGAGGLERLDLQAAVSNPASIRVAERAGFVREATLRAAWYRGPAREDMALFSLLPGDLGAGSA